jgi:hypothetical protein
LDNNNKNVRRAPVPPKKNVRRNYFSGEKKIKLRKEQLRKTFLFNAS